MIIFCYKAHQYLFVMLLHFTSAMMFETFAGQKDHQDWSFASPDHNLLSSDILSDEQG